MDEFCKDVNSHTSHQQYAIQSKFSSSRCLVVGCHLNSDTYTLTADSVFYLEKDKDKNE